MRIRLRAQLILFAVPLWLVSWPALAYGQAPPPQPPKKTPVGPPAPQSTHYPILLLVFGNDPNWSLRIGQKGPERLDRPGYPPIPLEPAEVTHEATAGSWTYHAKDSGTGAVVAVHLTRDVCTDAKNDTLTTAPPPSGKYPFRASVDHPQLGTLIGCARIAAELFPRINNQPDEEDEEASKKPPPPTVTNFKSPVAVAYVNPSGKIVFKRGATSRVVATEGHQLAVSHDGGRLLYTREDQGGDRTILLYDFASQKSTELLHGAVQQAFWSLDDTRMAFMKLVDGKWHLWAAPIASPDGAAAIYVGEIVSLHGWADAHTILVGDFQQLSWVGDDGTTKQTLSEKDLYGDSFGVSSASTVRIHPLNPDLLLVSTEIMKPAPTTPPSSKTATGAGFFLYEIRTKRRLLLSPPNLLCQGAEWSRDGLQIFFSGTDSSKRSATYRIFWDGTSLQKYASGTGFVIGQ